MPSNAYLIDLQFLANFEQIFPSYNNLTEKMLNFSALHNMKNKKLGDFFCQIVVGNEKLLKNF